MKVDLFDFHLPPERIAQHPATPRDSARLLEIGENLTDRIISHLPNLLRPGDMLVFNNTKVIPARLLGQRGDVKIEVTLLKQLSSEQWRAFARPGKRLRLGDIIRFGDGFQAEVLAKHESGEVDLRFGENGQAFFAQLERYGAMPLPPYIKREDKDSKDDSDYQTLFAKESGAVAAPTAGLHFTERLLKAIRDAGVQEAYVTLHVGAGTFLPVKVDDTQDHIMHSEYAIVSQETADRINAAKAAGGRIIAVGTTSLRTLESAADKQGKLQPFAQETDIFITPGYRFRLVDLLLTNFHLPRSTLFMLVSAFAGLERMQAAYQHAIAENYRFYSYGDACLLYRNDQEAA